MCIGQQRKWISRREDWNPLRRKKNTVETTVNRTVKGNEKQSELAGNKTYRGKFQLSFDQGKGNLVRVSWEFELSRCYCIQESSADWDLVHHILFLSQPSISWSLKRPILGDPGEASRDDRMVVVKVYYNTMNILSSRVSSPGSPCHARPFIRCLYFIYERIFFFARTQVIITLQWKSTLTRRIL